jgi:phage-related protein
MPYAVEYFHPRLRDAIEAWPIGVLADYAHQLELLMEFGPELRMPHSRALGGGLFELRTRGREGSGRAFYCFGGGSRVIVVHALLKTTRATRRRDLRIARVRMKEVLRG